MRDRIERISQNGAACVVHRFLRIALIRNAIARNFRLAYDPLKGPDKKGSVLSWAPAQFAGTHTN
jgi:hypothetical protein